MGNVKIVEPTVKNIIHYVEAFDLIYGKADDEIINEFKKDSSDVKVIKNRMHLINAAYHTSVPVDKVSTKILSVKNLDIILDEGKVDAVCNICKVDKNYFSFATKYCNFAKPKKYPIYDSLSSEALQRYNLETHFFSKEEIDFEEIRISKNYDEYVNVFNEFCEKYKLDIENQFSYKDIDKFLWIVGKNL